MDGDGSFAFGTHEFLFGWSFRGSHAEAYCLGSLSFQAKKNIKSKSPRFASARFFYFLALLFEFLLFQTMSAQSTINITLRLPRETDDKVKALALGLENRLKPAQIYRWLVEDALAIVEDESKTPDLPKTLALLRGLARGNGETKMKQ